MFTRFSMLDRRHRLSRATGLAATLLLLLCGCGASDVELVSVFGTVTLDGQPLPEAEVQFLPIVQGKESVRPSYGLTDEAGCYELDYSSTRSGARPGSYRVRITTHRPPGLGPDGKMMPAVPEKVPAVYNTRTTLAAEVTSEVRELNFDLKSDAGEIPKSDANVN